MKLRDCLAPLFLTQCRDHWLKLFSAAELPCGAIRSVGEVCEAKTLVERGVSRVMQHPKIGELRYIASALRFNDRPPPDPMPPPLLGEHGEQILSDWLGNRPEEVERLAQAGAFVRPGS